MVSLSYTGLLLVSDWLQPLWWTDMDQSWAVSVRLPQILEMKRPVAVRLPQNWGKRLDWTGLLNTMRRRFMGRSNEDLLVPSLNAGGEGPGDDAQGRQKVRFLSSTGNPQPHLRHFCPMCCSHIPHQCLLTWAALQREVVSSRVRFLRDILPGRMPKGSMRMRWLS